MSNEQNWTPGPWVVGPVDDTVITHVGANGIRYEVASIDGDYNEPDLWPIMEANARRIVDCVNACEGISDPAAYIAALRECVEASDGLDDLVRELKAHASDLPRCIQRDYMVLAAKKLGAFNTTLANLREVAP